MLYRGKGKSKHEPEAVRTIAGISHRDIRNAINILQQTIFLNRRVTSEDIITQFLEE